MAPEARQKSKAARIRELAGEKMSVSAIADQISKEYGQACKYQQVYNVLKLSANLQSPEERQKAQLARIDKRLPKEPQVSEIEEIPEDVWEESE